MSFQQPFHRTRRRTVEGMENMHSKLIDPPTASPPTPERLTPTNPVPEVMLAKGFLEQVSTPHTVQRALMHGMTLPTWDGEEMLFFLFLDPDGINDARDGAYPGPTIRMPRGVIFHGFTHGDGPPPHTIHWHGQEPTTMNDGVGHCSMELGTYTYQFQPNFIGSYFYHCHRNTVQHFEFGLFGFTIIDPPDAYFATLNDPAIPVGAGRDGLFRTAANLENFPRFGQDNFNPLTTRDPLLQFRRDPHAHTVQYDVEALWVLDDRDIRWSNLAQDARATVPRHGDLPGVNDNFHSNASGGNAGPDDFFAFNDFRSSHWYATGVNFPGPLSGTGDLDAGLTIPPELMSGKSGVQISIQASVGQNILIRVLCASYDKIRVTFPVDVVIIAWDGRALGVPPFGRYNAPFLVTAGIPVELSTSRRFDCMINSPRRVNSFAEVEFIDSLRRNQKRFTGFIPIHIN